VERRKTKKKYKEETRRTVDLEGCGKKKGEQGRAIRTKERNKGVKKGRTRGDTAGLQPRSCLLECGKERRKMKNRNLRTTSQVGGEKWVWREEGAGERWQKNEKEYLDNQRPSQKK